MGLLSVLSTQNKMKCFVVLSAVVACGFAAPVADADAQLIAGTYGHGLLGGVVAGHAIAAPAVAAYAAPAVATVAAAPAVATYAHAAPVVAAAPAVATYAHAAPVAVATAPVVHQVGYNVHHVPQVSVQKHVSTHTTSHVINHAPVVGAALTHGVVAAPAVAGVAGVVAV